MDNSTITQERAMRIWWVRSCKLYWCSKEQLHSWQTSCIALLQVYVVNIRRFLSSCLLWLVFRSWWGHQVREKADHPSSYNCYLPTLAQGLNKVLSGHLRQVDFYVGQVIYHWFLMAPGKPSTKSEVRLVQCQQNLRAACPEAQAGIQFFCESFPFPLLIGSSMFLFF